MWKCQECGIKTDGNESTIYKTTYTNNLSFISCPECGGLCRDIKELKKEETCFCKNKKNNLIRYSFFLFTITTLLIAPGIFSLFFCIIGFNPLSKELAGSKGFFFVLSSFLMFSFLGYVFNILPFYTLFDFKTTITESIFILFIFIILFLVDYVSQIITNIFKP